MVNETGVQSQAESYQKLKKIVLDAALLSTLRYKVRIMSRIVQIVCYLPVITKAFKKLFTPASPRCVTRSILKLDTASLNLKYFLFLDW